jgi:hypothetical protein
VAAFSITTATTDLRLDDSRKGQVAYTVTNTSHQNLRARGIIVVDGTTSKSWFSLAGGEGDLPVDSTQQFDVQVAVPPEVAEGNYRFRLDVADVGSPDEYSAEGPWTNVVVPARPQVKRPVPWLWIGIAAAVVLLLAAGGIAAFILTRPSKGALQATTKPDFGTVKVGKPAVGTVTVKNSGGQTGFWVQLTGDQGFALGKNGCTAKLSKGGSCQMEVTFTPPAVGPRQATLLLHPDNAPDPAPIRLSGTGGVGAITFTPNPAVYQIHFGGAPPVLQIDPLSVTVSNTGSAEVALKGVRFQQGFPYAQLSGGSCPLGQSLAAGQTCTLVLGINTANGTAVTFDPNTLLLLDTDLPGSPQQEHLAVALA